ncbi:hypothetical protein BVRB_029660 [Beta vulgaris subsp. vulgaris]|uniref:Uncharacterized protein n=1 Tax=Beta vulgaris subsp. vulgaris TaxID=3555 RepID=A0A0J8B124_BETVV|nr:hypothetical protein BVRB_029660 [Beta vulgaris subsp. vulgaris]
MTAETSSAEFSATDEFSLILVKDEDINPNINVVCWDFSPGPNSASVDQLDRLLMLIDGSVDGVTSGDTIPASDMMREVTMARGSGGRVWGRTSEHGKQRVAPRTASCPLNRPAKSLLVVTVLATLQVTTWRNVMQCVWLWHWLEYQSTG